MPNPETAGFLARLRRFFRPGRDDDTMQLIEWQGRCGICGKLPCDGHGHHPVPENQMNYAQALKKVTDEANPAQGMTREEIEAHLADITDRLRGPMSNIERLWLCEDRASLRKALIALS